MACIITLKAAGRLHCFSPDNDKAIEGLTVYFNSYSGQERRVVRCVKHDDLECDNESGFDCTLTDPQHATITVPDSFGEQSGSFRCQIAGVELSEMKRCPWPPQESTSREIASFNNSFPNFREDSNFTSQPGLEHLGKEDDDSSKIIVGGLLACLAVIILILVAFLLYKKRKRLGMQSCFSAHEDGDMPKSHEGFFERISRKCCLSIPNEGETTPAVFSNTLQKENGLPEKDGSHSPLILINNPSKNPDKLAMINTSDRPEQTVTMLTFVD